MSDFLDSDETSDPNASPEPVLLHATAVMSDKPSPDFSGLQAVAGGNSSVLVLLAFLTVGGGTASWKYWTKRSEQAHEFEMKKLQMEAAREEENLQEVLREVRDHLRALSERVGVLERASPEPSPAPAKKAKTKPKA